MRVRAVVGFRGLVSAVWVWVALAAVAPWAACDTAGSPSAAADAAMDAAAATDTAPDAVAATDAAPDAGPETATDAAPDTASDTAESWPQLVPPEQVLAWVESGWPMTLVDVREPSEVATGKIEGAVNFPWVSGVLEADWATLPGDVPVVVYCASGHRSVQAAAFLAGQGVAPLYDMDGGMGAWKAAGFPTVPGP